MSQLIKIDDLEIGDEILVPSGSDFRWFKVLALPKLNKIGNRMSSIRCSAKVDMIPTTKYDYKLRQRMPSTKKRYVCTGEEHNIRVSVQLNWKSIWLISRNGHKI